jgi:hypothetical protein
VPVNAEAVFTCQAYCNGLCDLYWIIGNTTANHHHRPQFEKQGYTFKNNENNGTNIAQVAIKASLNINGTQFECYAILDGLNTFAAQSTHAILLIISGIIYTCAYKCNHSSKLVLLVIKF